MPHKCVRCASIYPSQSHELMSGCSCGSRVFLFIRDENETAPSPQASTPADNSNVAIPKKTAEPDSKDYGWLEDELAFLSKDKPVSVDVEAVENLRILEKGAYEIDLPSLMKGEPLVIKSDRHVYYVKLPQPKVEPT